MKSVHSEIGNHIRQHRQRMGLTQEKLALTAGLTVSFLGDIERGNKNPTVESLEKLLGALNVSFREFFDYEAEIKPEKDRTALEKLEILLRDRTDNEIEIICRIAEQFLKYGDARASNNTPEVTLNNYIERRPQR